MFKKLSLAQTAAVALLAGILGGVVGMAILRKLYDNEKGYVEVMKSDLHQLAILKNVPFLLGNDRLTEGKVADLIMRDRSDRKILPSDDRVTIDLNLEGGGFWAEARHEGTLMVCVIYVGIAPRPPAESEGVAVCRMPDLPPGRKAA